MSFIFKITTITSPQTFVIPCIAEGTFNATVDYGDGTGSQTVTAYNDSNLTHSFATAGQHTITIDGTFPNVRFYDNAASRVLVDEVVDLGDLGWARFYRAFRDCTNLTAFNAGTADTSSTASMEQMFYNCSSLTSLDLSSFDTSSVNNMSYMFYNCSSLTSLDVTSFNTSSVTGMLAAFQNCSSLTSLDLSGFDTSSVTSMAAMFQNCNSLTSLNLSGFNTSSVNNMYAIFRDCSSLTSLDVSGFNTSSVNTMGLMFYNCSSLASLDLSDFDTSGVATMSYMFYNCSNLTVLDVTSFNTSSVTNMYQMFQNCTSLTTLDIKHFDVSNVTNGTNFLLNANNALTTTAYDELLEAWAAQDVQPNVPWHFGDAQYTVEAIADWYSPRSASSLSIINNKLVSIADSTATFGAAQQIDNLIIGNHYKIVGKAVVSNSAATVRIRVGSTYNLNDLPFNITATGSVTANTTFIATATTHYVGTIVTGHAANDTVTINAGITVKEITNYTEANAASEIEYSQENVFGSEEVVNGDFSNGTVDWDALSSASLSVSQGALRITNVGANFGKATQQINTITGKAYELTFNGISRNLDSRVRVGTTPAGTNILSNLTWNIGYNRFVFITSTTVPYVTFVGDGVDGSFIEIDNVSVKEITNAVEYKNIPQSARELYTLEDDTWVGSNELVVNGDFATDSDWSKGAGWTISGGKANAISQASNSNLSQADVIQLGKTYEVTYTISNYIGGYTRILVGGMSNVGDGTPRSGNGTYTENVESDGTRFYIRGDSFTGSVDNISIMEVIEVPS